MSNGHQTSIEIMVPYVDIEDSCVDVNVNTMYVGCVLSCEDRFSKSIDLSRMDLEK